jgi:hypothetical protein
VDVSASAECSTRKVEGDDAVCEDQTNHRGRVIA